MASTPETKARRVGTRPGQDERRKGNRKEKVVFVAHPCNTSTPEAEVGLGRSPFQGQTDQQARDTQTFKKNRRVARIAQQLTTSTLLA